jgi:hypothetical protein
MAKRRPPLVSSAQMRLERAELSDALAVAHTGLSCRFLLCRIVSGVVVDVDGASLCQ